MTIKEIAQQLGISDKAIYKRLKSEGIAVSSLKAKGSNNLSSDGEKRLRKIYAGQDPNEQAIDPEILGAVESVENKVEQVETKVENSTDEVENNSTKAESIQLLRLKMENAFLKQKLAAKEEELAFLRQSLEKTQTLLENSQQLQAIATSKIPTPALPAPGGIIASIKRKFNIGGQKKKQ